jgi:thiol-disulfide isomerase/thioredoxin
MFLVATITLLLWVMVFQIHPIPDEVEIASTRVVELTFKDIDGNQVPLSAFRHSLILVNFWASWCSPCKEELPMLDAFYRQHKDEGFILLAINVSDRPEDALKFIQERDYSFPLLYDPPGNAMVNLGIRGLPASLLVSREGYLLKRWVGPLSQEMLEAEVAQYLSGEFRE